MIFRRVKSDGVAHNSYVVAHEGEAVVIDPRRDIDVYLDLANEHDFRIKSILETHRNEDYAVGSTALRAATDAEILHSKATDFGYGTPVGDGDEVGVGKVRLRVLETPGHTPDSLTFVLSDRRTSDRPLLAFTGDALFVGDTGRVDLMGEDKRQEQAAQLHASLFDKLLPLGDGVILCPAHGGGSVCGGSILDRDESSLGYEKLTNPHLARSDRDEFVRAKLEEKHVVAPYFKRMEEWNQQGNAPIHERVPTPAPLNPGELAEMLAEDVVLVDARMPHSYASGHVPGSYNIWREGLSAYAGWMLPIGARYALILPGGADPRDVMRTMLRIGYDDCVGYLRGGFESWQNDARPVRRHDVVHTRQLREKAGSRDAPLIVDVRQPREWEEDGSIEGAAKIFLGDLEDRIDELPRDRQIVTMCSVGHRGGVAASILANHGFEQVANFLGGYTAWRAEAQR